MVDNGDNQNASGTHETKDSAEEAARERGEANDSDVTDQNTDATTLTNA